MLTISIEYVRISCIYKLRLNHTLRFSQLSYLRSHFSPSTATSLPQNVLWHSHPSLLIPLPPFQLPLFYVRTLQQEVWIFRTWTALFNLTHLWIPSNSVIGVEEPQEPEEMGEHGYCCLRRKLITLVRLNLEKLCLQASICLILSAKISCPFGKFL